MDTIIEPAKLIITTEGQDLQVVEIDERLTIGRSPSNSLVLDEKTASRNHAEIRYLGGRRYRISDLGSANGTWVNKRRITTPRELSDGDQIQIGAVRMRFVAPVTPQISHSKSSISGTVLDMRTETVVVLVSDVRNYTTMSEALPNREFSELMTQWFRETTTIIDTNGGTVDKFIGDSVMAYWIAGSKSDPASEVNAALHVAQTFIQSARLFSARISSQFPGYEFDVGVGLNVGSATLCNVGTGEHQSFTAVGDTVNVAFRLEPLSKTMGHHVIVSGEISACASRKYKFQELGETEVKGRQQPVPVFGLLLPEDAGMQRAPARSDARL